MMRISLLIALILFIGCKKKDRTDERPDPSPSSNPSPSSKKTPDLAPAPQITPEPKPKLEPKADPIPLNSTTLTNSYHDNQIGADLKYIDKLVRVKAYIEDIGRTKDGVAFIASTDIGGLGKPAPTCLFKFAKEHEPDIARVKLRDMVVVEGICRGRVDDGVFRGIQGFEFHVVVDGCRLVEVEAPPKPVPPKKKK